MEIPYFMNLNKVSFLPLFVMYIMTSYPLAFVNAQDNISGNLYLTISNDISESCQINV